MRENHKNKKKFYNRVVGTGSAGPVAAGPMFGQPTHAKML